MSKPVPLPPGIGGGMSTEEALKAAGISINGAIGSASPQITVLGQILPDDKVLLDRVGERGKALQDKIKEVNAAQARAAKAGRTGEAAKLALQAQSLYAELRATGYIGSLSYAEARTLPSQSWTEKQIKEFVNKGLAYKIDGFQPGMGMPEIQKAWDQLVQQAITLSSGPEGSKKWTPWEVLESYNQPGKFGTKTIDGWIYDIATGERLGYKGPLTKTTKQKNLNLSSAADVQVIATQALREALGRNPTAQELARFKSTINGQETANPEVTTTTTQLRPNLETGELETVSSDSTTTGGISAEAKAQAVISQVQGSDEQEKYSSSNYFSALLQMMGGG